MGCGSSNDVSYTQIDANIWRGKVKIWLYKATLRKDLQIFGKQDPYVKFIFGRQKKQSTVCEDGGQYPEWKKESFEFIRTNEDDMVYCQIWNKNLISDQFIGEGGFALTKVRAGTKGDKVDQSFLVYGKMEEIGEVFIGLEFELDEKCKNHPEVLAPDCRGQVIIKPQKATLQRDVGGFFGHQSPLCVIRLAQETQSTGICDGESKNPKWTDSLIFDREKTKDTFVIEVQNFNDSGKNDLIGVGFFAITAALPLKAVAKKTIDLYFEGHLAGNCQVEFNFIPADPSIYKKAEEKKVETPVQQVQPIQQSTQQPIQQQVQQQVQQPIQQQPLQFQQPMQQMPLQQQNIPVQQIIVQQMAPVMPMMPMMPTNGQGEFRFPNGDFYVGNWQNSLRHGYGKCQFISGMVYEGEWLNDMFHGQGKLTFSSTVYVGQFLNGKKSGQGTMTWIGSQQKYEGQWQENNYQGEGIWTFPNGQSKKAEFNRGQRVRWLDDQQFGLQAGRALAQGGTLPSPNGQFVLTLAYNGIFQIYNTITRQMVYSYSMFNRQIMQPFFLRLEPRGELIALDATGQPYFTSGQCVGQAPFSLSMNDTGRLSVKDSLNQDVWFLN